MTGWFPGPMAGFDLETTSPDPETARIVTAALVVWNGAGITKQMTWLANPGIEIPAEAAAIHGITTEDAIERGADRAKVAYEVSAELVSVLLQGAPLVIYNAPYDLTVLDRETRRYGVEPFGGVFEGCTGRVIDPFVLDKYLDPYRRGKRTLTAACEHYGVKLDGAHDAAADAIAAMRCAWKIGAASTTLAALSTTALHDLQVKAKADQAASFQDYLCKQGKTEVIDGSWPIKTWTAATA